MSVINLDPSFLCLLVLFPKRKQSEINDNKKWPVLVFTEYNILISIVEEKSA